MKMKWLVASAALTAVLFGALAPMRAQVFFAPVKGGKWNGYSVLPSQKFGEAVTAAKSSTWPGFGDIVPASGVKGHLTSIHSHDENQGIAKGVGGSAWIGLTDSPTYGGEEGGDQSALEYPPAVDEAGKIYETPLFETERGFGWVWTDGTPLDYQNWGGGEPNNHTNAANPAYANGEQFAHITASGTWNDNGDITLPAVVEYDLGLSEFPFELQVNLNSDGTATAKAVGVGAFAGKSADVQWHVTQNFEHVVRPPSGTIASGLMSSWYDGNWNNLAVWNSNLLGGTAPVTDPFRVPFVSWGNNVPDTVADNIVGNADRPKYPVPLHGTAKFAPTEDTFRNIDNYSARFQGQVFIPKGTHAFRDHNDDYAYLNIEGQTLINDNAWTGWEGTQNGGGAVGTFAATKEDQTVAGFKGGWYDIDFRGAEGGGGDVFRLLWNAVQDPALSPDPVSEGHPGFWTIGEQFLRSHDDPGLIIRRSVQLGFFDGPATFGAAGREALDNEAIVGLPTGPGNYTLTASAAGQTVSVKADVINAGGGEPIGCPTADQGDINCDGKVDLADFLILKNNFGKKVSSAGGEGAAAVPEPSTLLLGLLGLATLVGLRRRLRK